MFFFSISTILFPELAGELGLHAIALIKNIRLQGVNSLVITRNKTCHVQQRMEQKERPKPKQTASSGATLPRLYTSLLPLAI